MFQKASTRMPDPGSFTQPVLSQRALRVATEPLANLLMAKTLAQPELISLAAGFVDRQTLPVEPTRRALEAIWSDPEQTRAALQYGTTIGHAPLREAVLERMLHADGCTADELNVSIDQVVVTAGSNQLLFLIGDTLLDPGDIVLCGAPSYYVFLGALENLGSRAVGVEVDQYGLIPEVIEQRLARLEAEGELGRVKAIYVTTYYDNPSGLTMPAERRAALVEIAQRWSRRSKIYVIEDAAYRELRYYGDDTPSLRSFDPEGDTVIHAGTFSKSFSPGIRVGWGILPKALVQPILAQKGNIDFGSPNLNQTLMAAILRMGLFDPHIEQLRDGYRQKADAAIRAADEWLAPIDSVHWERPQGGLYVWLRLPESVDAGLAGPLFDRAVDEGVLYVPGEYCYPNGEQTPAKNGVRLSFGVSSPKDIHRGIEALSRAIRQVVS